MYNACIVRERKPGIARELRDKYMRLIDEPIAQNSAKGLIKLLEQAAEEFDRMTVDREVPRVGIVGEIFLKFNPFSTSTWSSTSSRRASRWCHRCWRHSSSRSL